MRLESVLFDLVYTGKLRRSYRVAFKVLFECELSSEATATSVAFELLLLEVGRNSQINQLANVKV